MMKIFKYLIPSLAIAMLSGCKEVYNPDINTNTKAISIEGIITNKQGDAMVKVYNAVPFDSTAYNYVVKGLNVYITDSRGNVFPMMENIDGYYVNASLYAEKGINYYVSVVTGDGTIYQSEQQTLPDSYPQDSIYAAQESKTELVETEPGNFISITRKGIETFTDLSSGSAILPKCRYDVQVIILGYFTDTKFIPPKTIYYWTTREPNTYINLTASKFDKVIGKISKHVLCFFPTDISYYYEDGKIMSAGFLIHYRKYNLSTETHQYYNDMKAQLEAEGKLFDPQPSTLFGNIKCVSNPGKVVFGFFEVDNVEDKYYRYATGGGWHLDEKPGFPEYTPSGESTIAPQFWFN